MARKRLTLNRDSMETVLLVLLGAFIIVQSFVNTSLTKRADRLQEQVTQLRNE